MDFLGILELVIGLVFVYFILGLVCTVIREILSRSLNLRAKNLELWLKDTFGNDLGSKVLNHKLIDGLTAKGRRASYLPTGTFVSALLDLVNLEKGERKSYSIDTLKENIQSSDLLPDDLKRSLLQSISEARGNLDKVRKDMGDWFDQAMIRITGTYKKHTQKALFVISLAVVFAFNADTISLSKYFHDNPAQRKAMVEKIDEMVNKGELEELYANLISDSDTTVNTLVQPVILSQADKQTIKELKENLEVYNLPIGWETIKEWDGKGPLQKIGWILSKLSGLLLTALAVSIGAPFWYDVLNKLVNLRAAGNPPKT